MKKDEIVKKNKLRDDEDIDDPFDDDDPQNQKK